MQMARALAFAVAFGCSQAVAQTTVAGFTPGSFRVTETGASEYRIPIQVPAGVAGLEPKLALVYNSQAANGQVGMGWGLSGLSAITRCPASMVQDGYRGGIKFDYADRYCLDGQRLVAITGNYGADGTEFRTERESFTKIIGYGTAGNGNAYFKAWTKSGQVLEFGNTTDSRIEATGRSTVRVWALNRISDTKGNYLTVVYNEDTANGDLYPVWVHYTGNVVAGTSYSASVEFTYGTKSDSIARYIFGSKVKTTLQLSNVKTYVAGGALVRDYRLNYQLSPGTGRSQLVSVQECDAANFCLIASVFTWRTSASTQWDWSAGFAPSPQFSNQGQDGGVRMVDLNGDGLVDMVWSASWSAGWNPSEAWLNNGSGWTWAGNFILPVTVTIDGKDNGVRFVDLNGDGLPDIVQYATWNGWTTFAGAWLNNGNGWAYAPQFTPGGQITIDGKDNGVRFLDLNGDGKVDHVQNGYWNSGPWNPNGAWLNNGNGWSWAPQYIPAQTTIDGLDGGVRFVDLNGDGLTDMVWSASWASGPWNPNYAWINNGNGWTHSPNFTLPVPITINGKEGGVRFVDLNGDGSADIVQNGYWSTGPWNPNSAWISNGDGWVSAPQYVPAQIALDYQDGGVRFVDLNGDGLVDMVWSANWPGWVPNYAWLNSGNGWSAVPNYNSPHAITSQGYDNGVRFEDLNGDGLLDIIANVNWGTATPAAWTNSALPSDFLARVTDGLGTTTDITYLPLTNPAVHVKESGAAYPVIDVQFPLQAARSVVMSNGAGGSRSFNYKFWGAKVHAQGGGFLGFHKAEATDAATGISVMTTLRQDYPYVGLPSVVENKQSSGTVINRVTNTWTNDPSYNALPYTYTTGKYHRSDLTQSVEQAYELSGSLVTTVTTTSAFDAYGNATQLVVGTGGYSKTTTNIFTNDVPNWLLGRLIRSSVASTTP
jgi:hypothetical protein